MRTSAGRTIGKHYSFDQWMISIPWGPDENYTLLPVMAIDEMADVICEYDGEAKAVYAIIASHVQGTVVYICQECAVAQACAIDNDDEWSDRTEHEFQESMQGLVSYVQARVEASGGGATSIIDVCDPAAAVAWLVDAH